MGLLPGLALAQALPPAAVATPSLDDPDVSTGFWRRSNLLGDMGGIRTALGRAGITLGLTETSEVLGNVSGGLKQGATFDGLTTLTLMMDTQKAFGWEGGTVNLSALQIHGRNLSQYYLGNLQTASGIEATPTTRLWEIWYQQAFLDGKFDVKLGQQSIDQEFMVSTGSALFVNTMMGWPMLPSADLYAGGPAYPLSSLGVRLRGQPTSDITVLGGVFQDNPPGGPFANDSQLRGTTRFGANFNLRTGALFIAEVQYAVNQPATGAAGAEAAKPSGLPGTYRLGVWYDTAGFPDARTGNLRRGNASLYGVVDQMVWRPDSEAARAIGVFARAMGASGDRNMIDFSLDAGVTLKAPFPGRDDDSFGIGYGLAHVGQASRAADAAARASGVYTPIRTSESFVEITYQAQVTPWLQVQPDIQYVFLPGAGIADPSRPTKRLRNETVLGVRSLLTF